MANKYDDFGLVTGPGLFGTDASPRIVSSLEWERLHPAIRERMVHAHDETGKCVKSQTFLCKATS